MTARHAILIVEDDPQHAEVLRDVVQSMDFDCRLATTLDEVKAMLATFEPCAVLQDMQIPHVAGARPHEKAGESSIRLVRRQSSGPGRAPIVVVTAFRSDPDFVWHIAELEADAFVTKANIDALADKLIACLKKSGREDHARCATCNGASRPPESLPRGAAILFAHDRRGVAVDPAAVAALHERRAEHDLFLDYSGLVDARGYLAGFRDHRRVFRETHLGETSAALLAELVEARRAIRADALRRLKHGGQSSAVRLVQQARKAVDVHVVIRGKESRTQ
jgi:DNA-binding response OmpR family regulator